MKKALLIIVLSVILVNLYGQNNAQFISQNVPSAVLPGTQFNISITFQNTGTTTWKTSDNYHLGSQSPQDNTTWGTDRIYFTDSVLPGNQITIIATLTAPSQEGIYNFQWQMVQDGVEWFGDYSSLMQINVDTVNDAQFIAVTALPNRLHLNEQFTTTITIKNTGSTTWTQNNNYKLGSFYPMDNYNWGVNRILLPNDVLPGDTANFTTTLTATNIEGLYNFQWKMIQDGVEWFGTPTALNFIPVINDLQDSLFTTGYNFQTSDHVIGTTLFHWFTTNGGQLASPWIPINGRNSWDGNVDFWKRMIKQLMRAGIDVLYVIVIPSMEEQRGNLFMALYELRSEGWNVPKVCPFFDPMITYTIYGHHGDASTSEGKDEIVGHYIRFYRQYFAVNTDAYADNFIYTQNNRPVLNVWHVNTMIDNYDQLTRNDVTSRLSAAFGSVHPIFNNDIVMITNEISASFSFADEKVAQFELQEYYHETNWNGINTCLLKPGYWDQNVRTPGDILTRDGGTHYRDSWTQIINNASSINRVQIESFNEYDEGSGIYAARTDTIYRIASNTNTDVWSDSNDPYEYIKDTYEGAKQFNMFPDYDASFLWQNIPDTMYAGDTTTVTFLIRNDGDKLWTAADNFKFGENETIDTVMFGGGRYLLNDTLDEIPTYGGIFRGKVKTFQIQLIAPDSIGTFITHWQMLQEYITWFGDTLIKPITVIDNITKTNIVNNKKFIIYPNPLISDNVLKINGPFTIGDK
ncbi:MAG: hypothetical protein J7L46_05915, partial [Bacteroidales bacterium]|nr:hypothetical protein [Bacteroidales bacterium]